MQNGSTAATEYHYDHNGNLTKDLNKNISNIQYNSLNLPSVVTFGNGNTITYLYTADGRKLRTVHVIGGTATTTDYCGNVIYENGTARLPLTEAGYIDLSDNSYHYYIKDHLGNNRVVADANGTVEESNQYYPFGLNYANAGSNVQPYKYNGKELDTKNGLNWYDYGARHYDAALGRWHVVDPLAEKIYSWSPYGYCLNNPVKYVDPTGCFASTHTDFLGNVIAVFNDGDLGVYRHDTDKEGVQIKLEKEYSPDNTSANGKKMGETYEWDSFVEPISKEPLGQIDFNSFKASQKVFSSLRTLTKLQPNSIKLLMYAFNANNTEGFDIKTKNPYFGSQFGNNKYISMRDAGNILAGILARSSGLSANITYTVFGAFQLSGNNRLFLPLYLHKAWSMGVNGSYGETPISHKFQRRGYELDF